MNHLDQDELYLNVQYTDSDRLPVGIPFAFSAGIIHTYRSIPAGGSLLLEFGFSDPQSGGIWLCDDRGRFLRQNELMVNIQQIPVETLVRVAMGFFVTMSTGKNTFYANLNSKAGTIVSFDLPFTAFKTVKPPISSYLGRYYDSFT